MVSVYSASELAVDGPDHLAVDVRALEFAAPRAPAADDRPPLDRLERLDADLEEIEGRIRPLRPTGPISSHRVSGDQERYFALRELADAIGEDLDRLFDRYSDDRLARLEARPRDGLGRKSRYRVLKGGGFPSAWRSSLEPYRLFSDQTVEEALRDLAATAEPEAGDADLLDVERRAALLRLMADAPPDDRPTYLWLRGYPPGSPCEAVRLLAEMYVAGWKDGLGVEFEAIGRPADLLASERLLLLRGIHARPLAMTEAGTHLFCPNHGNVVPVRVEVLDRWPFAPPDPFAFGPVLRTYVEGGSTLDLRTGLVAPAAEVSEALRTFTLAGLGTPGEPGA